MTETLPLEISALCCFLTALVFALYGTPVAARAAIRFGIVDHPDGSLKTHRGPVPYLGGLAVYVSFILTLALVFDFERQVLGLLLAGTILVLLGLIDDFGVLGVWPKFLGQGFATLVLIKSDIMIHIGALPEWANLCLTVIWIVGMTNALNIIDIMDGLASGTAAVAAAFLLVVAWLNGQAAITVMTAALVGSLIGFLRYNAHPAKIFMGDAGSLFVGMMLGSLAMIGKYDRVNAIGYLTPLMILAVPLFDTAYVMALRLARRTSPFRGSPDHFALRLRRLGLSVPAVAGLTWGLGGLFGSAGLLNLYLDAGASLLLVAGCAGFLVMFGAGLLKAPRAQSAAAPPDARREQAASGAIDPGVEAEARADAGQAAERAAVAAARAQLGSWRRR